jgi:hypothetical protein
VAPEPAGLVGTFVVEVGERQAWPFLTFCDNRTTPPTETRLYIDADWSVTGARGMGGLMMLTVQNASVRDGSLHVELSGGAALDVSGVPNQDTVGDVWWLESA